MTPHDSISSAKDAVRRQYGSVGDAYVISSSHAVGRDRGRMLELAAPTPSVRMLDIATGGGHVTRVFSPHVQSVVASDLTPEIIGHAGVAFNNWGLRNVTTQVADAEDLPFADGCFDLVTCRIAPHHFPDVPAFVHEVHRVIAGQGMFLLIDSTVPEGEAGEFFNAFERLRDPSHVRSLTVGEWTTVLEDSGFAIDVTETFRKHHDFRLWCARSRTPEDVVERLERMMLDAPEDIRDIYVAAECDDDADRLECFEDTKTLFRARKR